MSVGVCQREAWGDVVSGVRQEALLCPRLTHEYGILLFSLLQILFLLFFSILIFVILCGPPSILIFDLICLASSLDVTRRDRGAPLPHERRLTPYEYCFSQLRFFVFWTHLSLFVPKHSRAICYKAAPSGWLHESNLLTFLLFVALIFWALIAMHCLITQQ